MKITVIDRPDDPCSLRIYVTNVLAELEDATLNVSRIPSAGPYPCNCDLVWEPALAMRRLPSMLRQCRCPVVGTMHGVKAFALPISELENTSIRRIGLLILRQLLSYDWRWFKSKVAAVIAVSEYCASETISAFSLDPRKVRVIPHGVDRRCFCQGGVRAEYPQPYLLNVSSPNPIKNIDRLFAAYALMPANTRPALVAIVPGYRKNTPWPGIHIIREFLSPVELAKWYRGSLAVILPSLRETFGLPIVEAMSCGCPVVTTKVTGCAEVAGNAALLIDPRSVGDIHRAMMCVCYQDEIRSRLIAAGLLRARQFSWKTSAQQHLDLFVEVASRRVTNEATTSHHN